GVRPRPRGPFEPVRGRRRRARGALARSLVPRRLRIVRGPLARARISLLADCVGAPIAVAARWLLRLVAAFVPWIEAPRPRFRAGPVDQKSTPSTIDQRSHGAGGARRT